MAAPTSVRQKQLGAFYTPPAMAEKLVEWAVRRASDRALDPSFGGLVFLEAAQARLEALGQSRSAAAGQVFGVDLDEDAHRAAAGDGQLALPPQQLLLSDFFDVRPGQLPLCEAVVGNPPYIRYQGWNGQAARQLCAAAGVELTRLASSWAPFVIHATSFVAPGGRMALVLPGEMLHAQYAAEVERFLRASFSRLRLATFEERVFPGALEEVVLLLAEGRGEPGNPFIELLSFETLDGFDPAELAATAPKPAPHRPAPHEKLLAQLLPEGSLQAYLALASHSEVKALGSFGGVGIGAVTGDNSFFLMDEERAAKVPEELLRPTLSRARHARGVRFTRADLDELRAEGEPAWMFVASRETDPALRKQAEPFLRRGRARGVNQRYKCRVRDPWWSVPLPGGRAPDLFLTYFANEHPRLVLNEVKALCTNTLHGVHLERRQDARLLAAGFLNSLTLLSAELTGRSYGGGVLKLEPSEAQAVLLPPLAPVRPHLAKIDRLLRRRGLEAVLELTDQLLLIEGLGLEADEVAALRAGHERLRARRRARGKSRI